MGLATATVELRHLTPLLPSSGWFMGHLLRLEAWLDARKSRQALYRMDDQALADIGLTQADLGRPDPAAAWRSLLLPSRKG